MTKEQARELLRKYQSGGCTPEEKIFLDNWYLSEAAKQTLPESLPDLLTEEQLIWSRIQKDLPAKNNIRYFKRWSLVAAASVILFLSLGAYFILKPKTAKYEIAQHQINKSDIKPGTNTAILTLGNGNKIILNQQPNGKITLQSGVTIRKQQNGIITYAITSQGLPHGNLKISFNSIETPRGGEYQVVLPDGTNVWLNAASKLTYPSRFVGKERTVRLTGEAYFEVAHNAHQPFHVLFNDQDVRVLGTHFNINAYQDESESKTTLLQGSIALSSTLNHQPVMLTPGQQATAANGSAKFILQNVNTQQVISWKNGYFLFDNMDMMSIMRVISRWYDVDVKYLNVNKNETFGGTFSRHADLLEILKNLQQIGHVHFKIQNRTVIVDE